MAQLTDQINLRALRGFHAIVSTGSVTEAARRMGLSQPAVSRLLAQLEQQIGFELFFRDHGRLVPTQDGLLLYEEVDLSLGSVERVFSLIRDIADYRVGQLKVVAPPSFSEGVLPDIVAAFLQRFPRVRLSVDSRSIETSKAMIATRAADCGFVKLPVDRPDLRSEHVVSSATACVMAADHPLCGHDVLTPQLLRGHPLILLGLGRMSRAQIEAAFLRAGVRPDVRLETHTVGSACALAERGLGVALVNELLARPYLRPGSAIRPFEPRLQNDYAFVTSSLAAPTRLATEFLKQTRSHFGLGADIATS
ncbi:LysR family transcriptional regulator [Duganella sp. LjRoot269]|jgi:DNA-binding transcriptional LysR family regulator|uniref:LysR family transcriptional regulator n=1 Tax=Duganella sp. LjRoot269 TaxID=3342305 RepID=UPI003ECFD776